MKNTNEQTIVTRIISSAQVKGRDVGFQTTKEGEFWRILLPGIYTMEVFAVGYQPREVQFAVIEQNPTLLNITLFKDAPRRSDLGGGANNLDSETAANELNLKKSSTEDEVDEADEDEDEEEEDAGFLGGIIPNPFKSIQDSVKSIFSWSPFSSSS